MTFVKTGFCLWNLSAADGKLVILKTGRKSSDLLLYIGERKNRHEKQGKFLRLIPYVDKRYPEFLQELHFHRSRTGQMERIF